MLDLLIKGGTLVDGTGAPAATADVGIRDGRIFAVGRISGMAHRVIPADGLLVTPGFVDIHTHYDGQATWDDRLDPSFGNGVTTAIMGNCGVGFAPVRRGQERALIELMEGVEEIPGSALAEGLRWNWERFPEYLDALEAVPHSFDLGALAAHGPLRVYVMRDKVGTSKCASPDELDQMTALLDATMRAGAFGLSSSRTPVHRTVSGGMTPDFDVDEAELLALARVVGRHGGLFEFAPLGNVGEDLDGLKRDMRIYDAIARTTGAGVHLLVADTLAYPEFWRDQLAQAQALNASGASMRGQVAGRAICVLFGFFNTNPFMFRATVVDITRRLPRDRWLAELGKPEVRARILAEPNPPGSLIPEMAEQNWHRIYDMGRTMDYEPGPERSIQAIARREGRTEAEVAYDLMLAHGADGYLMAPLLNYSHGNLDSVRERLLHPAAVLSSSDAGAHVQTVCDGAVFSFMLAFWARDRVRGERLPIEHLVRLMTRDAATSVGLRDRGVVAPGMKADLNLIDFGRLALEMPRVVHDLPSGAPRLLQGATGYRATIVSGVVTREHDADTGARPGKLIRKRSALH